MISKQDIKKLAKLARITLAEEEVEALTTDAQAILGYVFDLGTVADAPLNATHTMIKSVLRDDTNPHASRVHTDALLQALPRRDGDFAAVRKVIERT